MQVIDDIFKNSLNIVGINVPESPRRAQLAPATTTSWSEATQSYDKPEQTFLPQAHHLSSFSPDPVVPPVVHHRQLREETPHRAALSVQHMEPAFHSKVNQRKPASKQRRVHSDLNEDEFSDMETASRSPSPTASPALQHAIAERAHRRVEDNVLPFALKKASSCPTPIALLQGKKPMRSIMKRVGSVEDASPPPPAAEAKPKLSKMKQIKRWFSRSAGSKKEMLAAVQQAAGAPNSPRAATSSASLPATPRSSAPASSQGSFSSKVRFSEAEVWEYECVSDDFSDEESDYEDDSSDDEEEETARRRPQSWPMDHALHAGPGTHFHHM